MAIFTLRCQGARFPVSDETYCSCLKLRITAFMEWRFWLFVFRYWANIPPLSLLPDLAFSLFLIELYLASTMCLLGGISLYPSSCVEKDRQNPLQKYTYQSMPFLYLERGVNQLWGLPVSLDIRTPASTSTVPLLQVALLSDMLPTKASPV